MSLGTPTFYHKAQFEFGGATANRNFSYYVGVAGYNQQFRFGSQYNGAAVRSDLRHDLQPVANNCERSHATAGCGLPALLSRTPPASSDFPLAPSGYALGPFVYDFNGENDDRESVVNLHFGIPHRKDGGKDDIQLLYDNSWLFSPFQTSLQRLGHVASQTCSTGPRSTRRDLPNAGDRTSERARASARRALSPVYHGPVSLPFAYFDTTIYNGPMGVKLNAGMLNQVDNYYFPNSPQAARPSRRSRRTQRDTYDNRRSVLKLQYQKNFGSNAFARIYGYTLYSDWLQNGPNSLLQNFTGGVSPDYELITHTRGVVGSFVDQLNSQHLLNFSGRLHVREHGSLEQRVVLQPRLLRWRVNASNPSTRHCATRRLLREHLRRRGVAVH